MGFGYTSFVCMFAFKCDGDPAGLFRIILSQPCADLHSGAQGNLHNRFGISFSVQQWPSPPICQHSALVLLDHISSPSSSSFSSPLPISLNLPLPLIEKRKENKNRHNLFSGLDFSSAAVCISDIHSESYIYA